jgi:hypothetical protein
MQRIFVKAAALILQRDLRQLTFEDRIMLLKDITKLYDRFSLSLTTDFIREMACCKTKEEWKSYPQICSNLSLEHRTLVVGIVFQLFDLGDLCAGQIFTRLKTILNESQWNRVLLDLCDSGDYLHRVFIKDVNTNLFAIEKKLPEFLSSFTQERIEFFLPLVVKGGCIFRFRLQCNESEVSRWFRSNPEFLYILQSQEGGPCLKAECENHWPCELHMDLYLKLLG